MKKHMRIKKAISSFTAVLVAVCLIAAASAVSAQNLVGQHYSGFENYIWHMSDNEISRDTIEVSADSVSVIKGAGAERYDNYWPSLSSRRFTLEGGKRYRVSFDVSGSGVGWYSLGGYAFNASGEPAALTFETAVSGDISQEWANVSSVFTADPVYTQNEIRVTFKGDAGAVMTVKNFDIELLTTTGEEIWTPVMTESKATLDGWETSSAGQPGISSLELSEEGCLDMGSVHFVQDFASQPTNGDNKIALWFKDTRARAEYTFSAYVKGSTNNAGDPVTVELGGTAEGAGAYWNDSSLYHAGFPYLLRMISASDGWVKVSYDFTSVTGEWIYLVINAHSWCGADFYLDNVSITEKGKTENLITAGDFRTEAAPAVEMTNWDYTDYSDPDNAGISDIELVTEGADDPGSLHFVQDYTANTDNTSLIISNCGTQWQNGKTYVWSANIKGNTHIVGDPVHLEIYWGLGTWEDGSTVKELYVNSSDWVRVAYEFTVSDAKLAPIIVCAGGYSGADFYIDNISVTEKGGDGTNLLGLGNFATNGNFCPDPVPSLTLEGWNDPKSGYSDPDLAGISDVELVADGADEYGSVHIYHNYEVNSAEGYRRSAAIGQMFENSVLGKTYTLSAKIKGNTCVAGDPSRIELSWGFGTFKNGSSEQPLNVNSADWTEVSYDFTVNQAEWFFISFYATAYTGADFLIDDITVCEKGSDINLLTNSGFGILNISESGESVIGNEPFEVTEIPGFDIGMLNTTQGYTGTIKAVPGGSYDGSTALEISYTGDSMERYFQLLDNSVVLGDTAVKASGYYKVTEGDVIPKLWIGAGLKKQVLGQEYIGNGFTAQETNGAVFTPMENGWVYFEMTIDEAFLRDSSGGRIGIDDVSYINFMFGIDDATGSKTGSVRFDNINAEIISGADAGDANNDGKTDILDLVRIKKYASGMLEKSDVTRSTWLSEESDGSAEMVSLSKFLMGATESYGE